MSEGSATDESWLDDYVDGSTSEEVMERLRNGMLLWGPDATPEEVAKATLERSGSDG